MAPKVDSKGNTPVKKSGFFKGVRSELKNIVWPTKKQAINYTFAVIVISIVISLFVWGLDMALRYLMSFILS